MILCLSKFIEFIPYIFYTIYGCKLVYVKIFISHEARFTPSSNFNIPSIFAS